MLPGYSLKNKDWALAVQENFKHKNDIEVYMWKHWQSGSPGDFSAAGEALNLLAAIGRDKVNIIAKSIGTLVAMYLIGEAKDKINKIVLCGIPLGDITPDRQETYREALTNFKSKNVLVIQNEQDSHGSYARVEQLIHSINKDINVEMGPGNTHDYPYFDEFNKFLKSGLF